MSQGWTWKPLGEVCKTGSGGTPLSSRKEFYEGGTIPWLVSGEVAQGNVREAKNFITAAGLENSSAKLFPRDTVLVAMYGATAGQVGILRFEATTNQAVCGILPNDKFVPEFLYYFLLAKKDDLVAQATGNAQPNISQIKIKNTEVPVLPLPEQQRIVSLLDEAYAGLATAKANAERNLKNARAIFESHLQAVFSQRGEGWEQKTLEDVSISFGRGKSKHRPRNDPGLYGGRYPFIQTGDIRNADHFIAAYSQTYNEVGLSQSKLWPKGTICITIAANIAETAILGFDACFPDSVIGVVANPDEAETGFIEYLLQSFKARIQAMGKGSAQANINLATFEDQRFPFPSVSKQKEYVKILDHLAAETQRLTRLYERKLAALEELKKSLLHQAFNGEL
jgi:type I restriction enzyme S subunit